MQPPTVVDRPVFVAPRSPAGALRARRAAVGSRSRRRCDGRWSDASRVTSVKSVCTPTAHAAAAAPRQLRVTNALGAGPGPTAVVDLDPRHLVLSIVDGIDLSATPVAGTPPEAEHPDISRVRLVNPQCDLRAEDRHPPAASRPTRSTKSSTTRSLRSSATAPTPTAPPLCGQLAVSRLGARIQPTTASVVARAKAPKT
jgi:hypothetical protein